MMKAVDKTLGSLKAIATAVAVASAPYAVPAIQAGIDTPHTPVAVFVWMLVGYAFVYLVPNKGKALDASVAPIDDVVKAIESALDAVNAKSATEPVEPAAAVEPYLANPVLTATVAATPTAPVAQ